MTAVCVENINREKKNHCFPFDLLVTQICRRSFVHTVKDNMNFFIDGMGDGGRVGKTDGTYSFKSIN